MSTRQASDHDDPIIEDLSQLAEPIAAGEKPRERWRIGTEHEKLVYRTADHAAPSYEEPGGIRDMLLSMEEYGWTPVEEGGKVIALSGTDGAISLEPAGQLELSGAPLEDLHGTCAETGRHLQQVKAIGDRTGVAFLGLGMWPDKTRAELPIMPKGRYDIMLRHMPRVGTMGLDMMLRTCTIQTNLDYSSEADMVQKFRVSLALQPLATALFANSPFTEGKPNVVPQPYLVGHRSGAHRHAAIRVRRGLRLPALRRLHARRADVLRLPRREIHRRRRAQLP
jgi:glutamate--cysteine ligase